MKKITNFIKEYWYVFGAILIAVIVISYWRKSGILINAEAIELPLGQYEKDIEINIDDFGDMADPSPVYNVRTSDKSSFEGFISQFDIDTASNEVEDGYKYGEESNYAYFYPSTGLAFITFGLPVDVGMSLGSEITEDNIKDVVVQLHEEVFPDFPEFRILSQTIDDSVSIKMDYNVEGYNSYISSYYLDGSAIEIEMTAFGKIKSLNILMISEIEFYENIPLMTDEELVEKINMTSYPKSIDFEVDDDEFNSLHPSDQITAYISELRSTKVINSWVYFNNTNGYAIPMYICFGEGIAVIKSLDKSFSADTILYVSPIEPKYIIVRYEDTDEPEEEEDPVGRDEGDLFVGEPL